ncbi:MULTISPECIES: cytochrome c [unclassified Sphingomonas]|uniref:c-type cytochrome n=1 Tax=unclassified Sphingomonas TaxID=196159 RepID=UPI000925A980|nr:MULTISPECIES: cytochrome c [unclassified Sphingomonas]OJU17881.1 MAG: hypothetical protein BGN95_16605 [Sphingomonas sp. 66-10]
MRNGAIALVIAVAGFGAALAQGGPHDAGPPTYQMRAPESGGDRFAASQDAAAIFSHRCGYCHLPAGMGTNLLTKQQVLAGNPPAMGLLTNRNDLAVDYVIAVARNGKGAMPPQTRVDITDAELKAVAAYLAKGKAR